MWTDKAIPLSMLLTEHQLRLAEHLTFIINSKINKTIAGLRRGEELKIDLMPEIEHWFENNTGLLSSYRAEDGPLKVQALKNDEHQLYRYLSAVVFKEWNIEINSLPSSLPTEVKSIMVTLSSPLYTENLTREEEQC